MIKKQTLVVTIELPTFDFDKAVAMMPKVLDGIKGSLGDDQPSVRAVALKRASR